ncbi:hypothetical protein SCAR479_02709 [Seiridium cardinale]|uniref:Uncharacterized protein n=1 Tax=Seiridium cardinale TaxID=138064 RepID=A0ABR2Y3D9_9PEZI
MASPEPGFPQFIRLPPELRRMAWHEAVRSCYDAVQQKLQDKHRVWVLRKKYGQDEYRVRYEEDREEVKAHILKSLRNFNSLRLVHRESLFVLSELFSTGYFSLQPYQRFPSRPHFDEDAYHDTDGELNEASRPPESTFMVSNGPAVNSQYVNILIRSLTVPSLDIFMFDMTCAAVANGVTPTDWPLQELQHVVMPLRLLIHQSAVASFGVLLQLPRMRDIYLCMSER